MKILITGAGGFIGSHFAKFLNTHGQDVYGVVRKKTGKYPFKSIICDLSKKREIEESILKVKPDVVLHLGGQTNILKSWQDPIKTLKTNIFSTLYIIQAADKLTKPPKIIIFGSSAEYDSSIKRKQKEVDSLNPQSPYALSKLTQDFLSQIFAKKYKGQLITIRPFAIIGPGKKGDLCSDIARRLLMLKKGNDELVVGNLNTTRDFLDIDDAICGIWKICELGKNGDIFNLCSGTPVNLRQLLNVFKKVSKINFVVKQDSRLIRAIDDSYLVGDNTKIKKLGWKNQVSIEKSIEKIFIYWKSLA